MLISTFNVNSLKSRYDIVKELLLIHKPDFLLLQEIKGNSDETHQLLDSFKEIGYYSYSLLQKTYNGVAILSKDPCEIIDSNLPNYLDEQARLITVKHENLIIVNAYMPNGNPLLSDKYSYKLQWTEHFYQYIKMLLQKYEHVVIGGDFNIAPTDNDVYSMSTMKGDAIVQVESRHLYQKIINLGFLDSVNFKYGQQNNIYTWWDYRGDSFTKNNGARIDHILLSSYLSDKYRDVYIDKNARIKEKPSDHGAVFCLIS